MDSIVDEFKDLMQPEDNTLPEVVSKEYVDKATDIINKSNGRFCNKTYQGIKVINFVKCLSIDKCDAMPWDHVIFTIDTECLRDVSNDRAKSLTIPDFVEEIGRKSLEDRPEYYFEQITQNCLVSVTIPKSVLIIDSKAFALYSKLELVTFEKDSKLIFIGDYAFAGCKSFKTLDIRNCLETDIFSFSALYESEVTTLKMSSNIRELIGDIDGTKLKTIYIDNTAFSISEFKQYMENSDNKVFWDKLLTNM